MASLIRELILKQELRLSNNREPDRGWDISSVLMAYTLWQNSQELVKAANDENSRVNRTNCATPNLRNYPKRTFSVIDSRRWRD